MTRTLDRYMLRETLVPFAAGTLAVVVMLLGGILYDNADVFFRGNVPIVAVAQLLLYRIPYLLVLTLPAGTVVATSLIVSRMARDSEITVMRTAGIPLWRIFLPLMVGAIGISALDFVLGEKVMPGSQKAYQNLINRMLFLQPQPNIRPNVMFQVDRYGFIVGSSMRQGNAVFMRDITMFEKSQPERTTITTAKSGTYDAGKWTLRDAWVHQMTDAGDVVSVHARRDVTLNLRTEFGQFAGAVMTESLTFAELGRQIKEKRRLHQDTQRDEVGYHSKLAVPAASFFLALISPLLALAFARSGSFMGVLLSIILVFVYWNTLLLFRVLGANGVLLPVLAAWMPNLLFGAIGLTLMRRSE